METNLLGFMQQDSLVILDCNKQSVTSTHWEGGDKVEIYLLDKGYRLSELEWGIFKNSDIDIVHETRRLAEEYLLENLQLYQFFSQAHTDECPFEMSWSVIEESEGQLITYHCDIVCNQSKDEDGWPDEGVSMNVYLDEEGEDPTDGGGFISFQDLIDLPADEEYKRHQMIMDKIDFINSLIY